MHTCMQVLTRGQKRALVGSPGVRVTGNCELPDISTGNRTQLFSKAAKALDCRALSKLEACCEFMTIQALHILCLRKYNLISSNAEVL
ncbi:mCG147488, partial [Mus musculus]